MTKRALHLPSLVLVAALGPWASLPGGAAPMAWLVSSAAAPPGEIEIDASEVGTMPPTMVREIQRNATTVIVDAGLDPAAVTVSLVEVDPLEIIRGVRVSIVTDAASLVDPEHDSRGPLLAQCRACSDGELAGLAIEATLEAVDRFEELTAPAAPTVEPTSPGPSPPEPSPPEPTSPDEPERVALGPAGWAGVGLLGLGLAGAVTGAVLASREPAPFPDEPTKHELRDLRPPGYTVLGVGGALLVTGAVLLVVDRRRARRSPQAHRPVVGPSLTGIEVIWRF